MRLDGVNILTFECQKLASKFSHSGTIRHQLKFQKDDARHLFGARLFGISKRMGSGGSGDKKERRVRSARSREDSFDEFLGVSRDQII